ncbi:hypothetical protein [Streptomyces sp. NPDC001194]|uniref:hypothetical protein n=1 Tax=Streptomyces sp. NPDC001194 TaxID=3364547 RepID=UPI0036B0EC48
MIDERNDGWSFATARVAARFGACEVRGAPGVEHAGGGRGTRCGFGGAIRPVVARGPRTP